MGEFGIGEIGYSVEYGYQVDEIHSVGSGGGFSKPQYLGQYSQPGYNKYQEYQIPVEIAAVTGLFATFKPPVYYQRTAYHHGHSTQVGQYLKRVIGGHRQVDAHCIRTEEDRSCHQGKCQTTVEYRHM